MLLLGFDTSAGRCSAAVAEGGTLREARSEELSRGHAERLMPMIQDVMASAGVVWSDLDALTVTIGPGSFTGVRTGIAAARGLALAVPIRVVPVTVFSVLADIALTRTPDDQKPVVAVIDARRQQVYAQAFDHGGRAVAEPRAIAAAALAAEFRGPCRWVGSGTPSVKALGRVEQDEYIDIAIEARYLVATAYRLMQQGVAPVRGFDVHPLYLRPPDANPAAGRSLLETAERR